MPAAFAIDALVLAVACALQFLARRSVSAPRRPDGAPSLGLLRASACADLVVGIPTLIAILLAGGRLLPLRDLQVRDPLPALLIGVLGGLFLHLTGGGSPLPAASLHPLPAGAGSRRDDELGVPMALLLLSAVAAQELIWRGVGYAGLANYLPGLVALVLSATGYGLQRGLSGEDAFALAALDGILLGVIFRLSSSLLAAALAHLIADAFAYTSVLDQDSGLKTPD